MIWVMVGYLSGLIRRHRVLQLFVRNDKRRAAKERGCIWQSSVGLGKLGEVRTRCVKWRRALQRGTNQLETLYFEIKQIFFNHLSLLFNKIKKLSGAIVSLKFLSITCYKIFISYTMLRPNVKFLILEMKLRV